MITVGIALAGCLTSVLIVWLIAALGMGRKI